MAKNILLCFGGDDPLNNVVKLLHIAARHRERQIAFYGASALPYGNVREDMQHAYSYLLARYVPGDKIYLFGCSLGAFTARNLGGFLSRFGILPRKELVREAFRAWFRRGLGRAVMVFRERHSVPCPIELIGVWDTVGAIGSSIKALAPLNHRFKARFRDYMVPRNVKVAYHALSIDEQRVGFAPHLWDETAPSSGQVVEQV